MEPEYTGTRPRSLSRGMSVLPAGLPRCPAAGLRPPRAQGLRAFLCHGPRGPGVLASVCSVKGQPWLVCLSVFPVHGVQNLARVQQSFVELQGKPEV